jgi:parallel beta-helix repeat protein
VVGNWIGRGYVWSRNVLSGNGGPGILVVGGHANSVWGNFIGADAFGRAVLGNAGDGVALYKTFNDWIGDVDVGRHNVIAANLGNGVRIEDPSSTSNHVVGNTITANGSHGVLIGGLASNNGIGDPGSGNTIADNRGDGVRVASGEGNSVQSNSIYDNDGLGIDLEGDGVTPNDGCDADGGANQRQNAPRLTWLWGSGGAGNIQYELDVCPPSDVDYVLEFYSSPSCDPAGSGEGRTLVSSGPQRYGPSLRTSRVILLGVGVVPPGHFVTATATDPAGNTSEFSNCVMMRP